MSEKSKKSLSDTGNIISVYFRVDADEKLGLGHLSRCRSLMLAFLNVAEAKFSIATDNKEMVKKFIPNIGFDVYDINSHSKEQHFDIAIIDAPNINRREEGDLQKLSDLIACIDDEGPGLSCQGILIRPNLLNLPKPPSLSADNYWSGRDYIVLHPDFAIQACRRKSKNRKVKKLLVCFGGSDPRGLTLRVIPLLRELEMIGSIHIILGAAFPWGEEVKAKLNNDIRFSVNHNILNMAQSFWDVDAALISGGTLLYEACSLGIPAVVVPQNESQEAESKICHAAGAVVSFGVNEAMSDDRILVALQQLMEDDSLREKMSKQGPKIVSPNGAAHIVSRLLSYVKKEAAR